jgi:hypothetical protein
MADQISHFALVVYPQFEVLDAFGPTEVLHGIGHPMVNPNGSNIKLSIVGPSLDPVSTGPAEGDPSPVKSRVAQTIVPTHTFDDPPKDIDVLIVPGGFGAGPKALWGGAWEPAGVERVVRFLRETYPGVRHLLSMWILLSFEGTLDFWMHELTECFSSSCLQRCRARRARRNPRWPKSHYEQTDVEFDRSLWS